MKNIHITPTDKLSKLLKFANQLIFDKETEVKDKRNQNIYITSDEEIKEEDYGLGKDGSIYKFDKTTTLYCVKMFDCKKIILTTDEDLIKDGVQAIDDEFLEWFVKNQSCEEIKVNTIAGNFHLPESYKIILPKEELHFIDDEVECNNCGNIMSLTEDKSILICTNSECTSCYEDDGEWVCGDCNKTIDECNCIEETIDFKQESMEKVAFELYPRVINDPYNPYEDDNKEYKDIWIEGAK
jgi:hypothetical protein